MRVVQINTYDTRGGAAKAAHRLHKGLRKNHVDCQMIVKKKFSEDNSVLQVPADNSEEKSNERFFLSTIQNCYINAHRTDLSNTIFTLPYPGIDLSSLDAVKETDIINLHWIAYYQSPITLAKLFSLGKPVVWTLHDQRAFTGGCHYSAGCMKYQTDCSGCPQLSEDPLDLAAALLKDDMELFRNADLTIVTPSRWLAACVKESSLFKDLRVEVIPNSLDTDVFIPRPNAATKEKLGLSPEDVVLFFGAENPNEKRKGFNKLMTAMRHCFTNAKFREMAAKGSIKVLSMGYPTKEMEKMGLPVVTLGYLESDIEISEAYSAADMFLLPSLEDNLPNTMLESLSCGTPVVAFDIGGIPDAVKDNMTGKLAAPDDAQALGDSIMSLIFNPDLRNKMGLTGRSMMTERFAPDVQANRYTALYAELMKNVMVHSSEKEHVNKTINTGKSLGNHFGNIYEDLLNKSLREVATSIQAQLVECKQLTTERETKINILNEEKKILHAELRSINEEKKRLQTELKLMSNTLNDIKSAMETERKKFKQEIENKTKGIEDILNSISWKMTSPVRAIIDRFKKK